MRDITYAHAAVTGTSRMNHGGHGEHGEEKENGLHWLRVTGRFFNPWRSIDLVKFHSSVATRRIR
jgi:hypothetical protein